MKKNLIVTGLAAVIVLAATVLPAQVEPAPYITIHYDTIDPAMTQAYETNGREWVDAFRGAKAGKDFYWRGYKSGFNYAWVSDMPNYAFMDASKARNEMLTEKMGEGKMDELESGASGGILQHHNEIWKYQPEMSYTPEGFDPAKMKAINVTTDRVKPSMDEQFRELVKDAVAAMKKIDAPINFLAYSVPFGEGDYAFVSWGKDRAALHSGPDMGKLLGEALGAEGAQDLLERYLDCIKSSDEVDWQVRRDLSYMSDEMMEDKPAGEAAE